MKSAAGLCIVVVLGLVAGTAVGRSAAPTQITTTLPITATLPISTTLPVTTTLPKITTTLPVTTTLQVTTTLPKITTTLPVTTTLQVTTTLPKITTTGPVTTTLPKTTTTLPVSTALPNVTTTVSSGTALPGTTPAARVSVGGATGSGATTSTPTVGLGVSFLSGSNGPSTPAAASASLFSSSSSSSGVNSTPTALTRLVTSRGFLTYHGPKMHRFTVVIFRLRHSGRVRFTVVQVAPLCRVVGSFTVRGHAGTNRVRFDGRLKGRRLAAGTYEIGVRTRLGTLRRVTVAIFGSGKPTSSKIKAARNRNVCGASSQVSGPALFGFIPFATGSQAAKLTLSETTGAVLASTSERRRGIFPGNLFVRQDVAKSLFLILLFGASAVVLGIAAVPRRVFPNPNSRVALTLVRRRFEMTGLGFTVFLVALVSLALR